MNDVDGHDDNFDVNGALIWAWVDNIISFWHQS